MTPNRNTLRRKLQLALSERVKGALHFDTCSRKLFSTDASIMMVEPLAAAVPQDIDDLRHIVRTCKELNVPIHPRGGATGLAGESLGRGLVIDLHPGFRKIGKLDRDSKSIQVASGATLQSINRASTPHGLQFGPDPSSGSRATIGGMIGTNATGAHSLQHGYTSEHVLEIDVMLDSGKIARLHPTKLANQPKTWRSVSGICDKWKEEIATAYPKQHRNRSGYNLRGVWDGENFNPIPLICGAEGSLGIVVSATLELSKIAKHSCLALLLFDDLYKAADAVTPLMKRNPSAIELIDDKILAAGRRHDSNFAKLLPEAADGVLLVEFCGDSKESIEERMHQSLQALNLETCRPVIAHTSSDKHEAATLWRIRKEAEALVANRGQGKRAISFIEDTAVPYRKLGQWLRIKSEVLDKHGFDWATFGHAAAGELHTKVYIDPFSRLSYERLAYMAGELYERVVGIGGSISGEHGDGLIRSPYLGIQYPKLSEAFIEVKKAIDPDGIFNPGRKIPIEGEHPAIANNRLGDRKFSSISVFPAALNGEVSSCHGCGACREETTALRMCPLYKLTGNELASPRAKGNLSRMIGLESVDEEFLLSNCAAEVADYCFNCGMCKNECPSHVDIPGLMLEIKAARMERLGLDRSERFAASLDSSLALGKRFTRISNTMLSFSYLSDKVLRHFGFDPTIAFPSYERGSFEEKAFRIKQPESEQSIVFYADFHVMYHNHDLGLSFIRLMNALGFRVEVYAKHACGLPALDFGDKKRARNIIMKQLDLLAAMAIDRPVVCTEPSAALMIKEHWPKLVDNEKCRMLSSKTYDACSFILKHVDLTIFSHVDKSINKSIAYHSPCHLLAIAPENPSVTLLAGLQSLDLTVLETGCCGIAGTWGMLSKNRKASLEIGRELFETLKNGRFDNAVTDCSTCRMQIMRGTGLDVLHPINILAEFLDLT